MTYQSFASLCTRSDKWVYVIEPPPLRAQVNAYLESTYEELSKTCLGVFWRVTAHIYDAIADGPRSAIRRPSTVTLHSRDMCCCKTHCATYSTRSDLHIHRAHTAGRRAARGRPS